jgi:hypothetical protein
MESSGEAKGRKLASCGKEAVSTMVLSASQAAKYSYKSVFSAGAGFAISSGVLGEDRSAKAVCNPGEFRGANALAFAHVRGAGIRAM